MIEIWKDIEDYSNYQVSNLGRVRNTIHNYYDINTKKVISKNEIRIKKQSFNRKGYLMVGLTKNGKQKNCLVHRLVANAFISNNDNKPQINHKDGNKTHNCIDNLEWCTQIENMRHSWETGLRDTPKIRNHIIKFNKLGRGKHKVKTMQYDKNMNLIKEWASMKEASQSCGITYNNIWLSTKGIRKTAGGYIWKH